MAERRILLVEDDEDMLTIIQSMLEGWGNHVTAVGSAGEAVEAAQRRSPDLLIVNMNLPDARGTEVMERVRRFHSGIPIILVSGSPESEAEGREAGVDRFLAKPFRMEELRSMVGEAWGEGYRRS